VVPKDQPLDLQTLKNLSYMKNVLSETLRLYPSGKRSIDFFSVLKNGYLAKLFF
jgi:hypothetical protein